MSLRVLLKSPLTPFTGYGNDGIGLVLAMQDLGIDVTLDPMTVQPPLPPQVAALLTRPIEPPYDLLIHHVDPIQAQLEPAYQKIAHRRVLWTMWEYWGWGDCDPRPCHTDYDLIVAYDQTTAWNFSNDGVPLERLKVIQGGYDPAQWLVEDPRRDWDDPIRFCMAGALAGRKAPFVAIKAHKLLKESYDDYHGELHLKTLSQNLHPGMEKWALGVKIHFALWNQPQMKAFYQSCHAYISTSTGEGKDLPAVEAATTGAVPILSPCGGHLQWHMPSTGYLLPGIKVPLHTIIPQVPQDDDRIAIQVTVEDTAAAMYHVYTHRQEASEKGIAAAEILPKQLDWRRQIPLVLNAALATEPRSQQMPMQRA